jgi:hypothetical protein
MTMKTEQSLDGNVGDRAAFLTDGRTSRRAMLQGLGALGVGLVLSRTGLLQAETPAAARLWSLAPMEAETERIQDILDILATNEAFGVTLVGTVLDYARKGAYSPAIPDGIVKILTGVRSQEQYHLDWLKSAGAKLRTDTFHIPDLEMLSKPKVLFRDLVELEDSAIGAVIASLHTFTREKRIDLLKANFQFATEESEHRFLANRALGFRPPNDHSFAAAQFGSTAEFYKGLQNRGIIDGSVGLEVTYPGPGAVDGTGVSYRTPGGPMASCSGSAGKGM